MAKSKKPVLPNSFVHLYGVPKGTGNKLINVSAVQQKRLLYLEPIHPLIHNKVR